MARSGAQWPRRRDLLRVRQFRLRLEVELPDLPLLCMVAPIEAPVPAAEVFVNTAHGLLGYEHAAYHAEQPLAMPRACWIGLDCGYVDTGDGADGLDWGDDVDGERDSSSWVDGVT